MDSDWTEGAPVDAAAMRATMGAIPSGVIIITTMAGAQPVGLTISSFASVSLNPPLLLACVSRTANSLRAFRTGGAVAINVLAHDQSTLATTFAGSRDDRFAGVDHFAGPNGAPLLSGVAAWISGDVERIYDAGDHVILLTRVRQLHHGERPPLLYHGGAMHDWTELAQPAEYEPSLSANCRA